MPICDEKRLIFLHVPKTAGTFIRNLLDIRQFVNEDPKRLPSPQHLTCKLLKSRLGDKYDSYFKFTFVRNPWSRFVSEFEWRRKRRPPYRETDFQEFLQKARSVVESQCFYDQPFDDHFIPQVNFTTQVDAVYRYENLADGLNSLAQACNLEIPAHEQKPIRSFANYSQFYDSNSRALIADLYAEDIRTFGYEFSGDPDRGRGRSSDHLDHATDKFT